ncbi:MAG: type II toxin-antitoxin system antitoxin SocA domain-containing protein [Spirochaetota bacterium]
MKPYQKERFENAVCFFSSEHFKKTKKYPSPTHIYKYLAFFEFEVLEETGSAPLELEYKAMDHGPVPYKIWEQRRELKSELFRFEEYEPDKIIVKALKTPNLDYFSEYEIEKMNTLIFIFASTWTTAGIMSDASHEKIKAWKKAFTRQKNSIINMAETFDDLQSRPEGQLTPAEEHFLISQALKMAGV